MNELVYNPYPVESKGNCCCNFNTLIILILVLLQFSGKGISGSHGHNKSQIVDNGILFIIALFYLVCCNPCK